MPRRIATPLLAACLACVLSGCGSTAAGGAHPVRKTAAHPAPASPSPSDPGFAGQHLIIGVECGYDAVDVVGIDPDSGDVVTRRTFTVPPVPDRDGCGEAILTRQLFDRDYERMAVQIHDEQNDADHVGYVDASGKLHDLTGDPGSGFSDKQPHETSPVFDRVDNQIWYLGEYDGDQAVYSRNATTGARTDRGTLPNRYGLFVYQGKQHATDFSLWGGAWLADPSETAMVSQGIDPTGESIEFKAFVGGRDTEPTVDLPDAASGCGPVGWVDDHTVLCREVDYSRPPGRTSNFYTITLSADFSRVTAVGKRILPDNDRDNTFIAIANDGSEMIFEADRGDTSDFYRLKLQPGSAPAPTAAIPADYSILEWR